MTASPPAPRLPTDHGLDAYAEGTAGEAWVLVAKLMFVHGKPRFPMIAGELGLSPPQAMLLRLIAEPQPMSSLADTMHCDNSNLTGLADRLEERGLAERRPDPRDRRVKLLASTEAGAKLSEELSRRMAEPPEAILRLSEADQETLVEILRKTV
ncbi:MAG TPA: MarR family transcriptional regulator [Solirubrobacterales bacterium]